MNIIIILIDFDFSADNICRRLNGRSIFPLFVVIIPLFEINFCKEINIFRNY
jgi:hypothetical protein